MHHCIQENTVQTLPGPGPVWRKLFNDPFHLLDALIQIIIDTVTSPGRCSSTAPVSWRPSFKPSSPTGSLSLRPKPRKPRHPVLFEWDGKGIGRNHGFYAVHSFFGVELKSHKNAGFSSVDPLFRSKKKHPRGLSAARVNGGRCRTRTCDLPHVKRMLYQLS